MKRQKAALANMKAETTNALRALEELYLTITLIREVIRPLLPADSPDAQLTAALLAQNIGVWLYFPLFQVDFPKEFLVSWTIIDILIWIWTFYLMLDYITVISIGCCGEVQGLIFGWFLDHPFSIFLSLSFIVIFGLWNILKHIFLVWNWTIVVLHF